MGRRNRIAVEDNLLSESILNQPSQLEMSQLQEVDEISQKIDEALRKTQRDFGSNLSIKNSNENITDVSQIYPQQIQKVSFIKREDKQPKDSKYNPRITQNEVIFQHPNESTISLTNPQVQSSATVNPNIQTMSHSHLVPVLGNRRQTMLEKTYKQKLKQQRRNGSSESRHHQKSSSQLNGGYLSAQEYPLDIATQEFQAQIMEYEIQKRKAWSPKRFKKFPRFTIFLNREEDVGGKEYLKENIISLNPEFMNYLLNNANQKQTVLGQAPVNTDGFAREMASKYQTQQQQQELILVNDGYLSDLTNHQPMSDLEGEAKKQELEQDKIKKSYKYQDPFDKVMLTKGIDNQILTSFRTLTQSNNTVSDTMKIIHTKFSSQQVLHPLLRKLKGKHRLFPLKLIQQPIQYSQVDEQDQEYEESLQGAGQTFHQHIVDYLPGSSRAQNLVGQNMNQPMDEAGNTAQSLHNTFSLGKIQGTIELRSNHSSIDAVRNQLQINQFTKQQLNVPGTAEDKLGTLRQSRQDNLSASGGGMNETQNFPQFASLTSTQGGATAGQKLTSVELRSKSREGVPRAAVSETAKEIVLQNSLQSSGGGQKQSHLAIQQHSTSQQQDQTISQGDSIEVTAAPMYGNATLHQTRNPTSPGKSEDNKTAKFVKSQGSAFRNENKSAALTQKVNDKPKPQIVTAKEKQNAQVMSQTNIAISPTAKNAQDVQFLQPQPLQHNSQYLMESTSQDFESKYVINPNSNEETKRGGLFDNQFKTEIKQNLQSLNIDLQNEQERYQMHNAYGKVQHASVIRDKEGRIIKQQIQLQKIDPIEMFGKQKVTKSQLSQLPDEVAYQYMVQRQQTGQVYLDQQMILNSQLQQLNGGYQSSHDPYLSGAGSDSEQLMLNKNFPQPRRRPPNHAGGYQIQPKLTKQDKAQIQAKVQATQPMAGESALDKKLAQHSDINQSQTSNVNPSALGKSSTAHAQNLQPILQLGLENPQTLITNVGSVVQALKVDQERLKQIYSLNEDERQEFAKRLMFPQANKLKSMIDELYQKEKKYVRQYLREDFIEKNNFIFELHKSHKLHTNKEVKKSDSQLNSSLRKSKEHRLNENGLMGHSSNLLTQDQYAHSQLNQQQILANNMTNMRQQVPNRTRQMNSIQVQNSSVSALTQNTYQYAPLQQQYMQFSPEQNQLLQEVNSRSHNQGSVLNPYLTGQGFNISQGENAMRGAPGNKSPSVLGATYNSFYNNNPDLQHMYSGSGIVSGPGGVGSTVMSRPGGQQTQLVNSGLYQNSQQQIQSLDINQMMGLQGGGVGVANAGVNTTTINGIGVGGAGISGSTFMMGEGGGSMDHVGMINIQMSNIYGERLPLEEGSISATALIEGVSQSSQQIINHMLEAESPAHKEQQSI